MLKRIKNSLIIGLIALVVTGCSGMRFRPDPELKTCSAHYESKIVAEYKAGEEVVPSITYVYGKDTPPSVSDEVGCLVVQVNRQVLDKPLVLVNFYNSNTKALVHTMLDRKNGVFVSLQVSQSAELPADQVMGLLIVLLPLDGVLDSFSGNKDAMVLMIEERQGAVALDVYAKLLSDLTGGKLKL